MSQASSRLTWKGRAVAASYDRLNARGEQGFVGRLRAAALPSLTGSVLEIGAGTGVNLGYYRCADKLTVVEPDKAMRQQLLMKVGQAQLDVEVCEHKAENLAFRSASFDAVVATFSLCAVDDQRRVLQQALRVLRPEGQLVILDHVRAEGTAGVLQDAFDPIWSRLSTGCHLNRHTVETAREVGFEFERLEWHPGWPGMPWMGPIVYGRAYAR